MNYFNLIENRSLSRKITFKQVSLSSLGLVCFLQQGKRLSKIRKIRIWIWRTSSLNLNRVTVICMEQLTAHSLCYETTKLCKLTNFCVIFLLMGFISLYDVIRTIC